MEQGKRRTGWLAAWAVFIALVSFVAGTRAEQLVAAAGSALGLRVPTGALDMNSVQEAYRQLKAHYDGSLDDQALIDGAKRGLVAAAGDAHTSYLNQQDVAEFEKSMSGSIGGGIGAEIGLRNDRPTIVRPLKGSPAERSGVRAGDVIVKINDEVVLAQTVDQVVAKIRGEVGSTVKLTLLQGRERRELSITRRHITAPTVEWEVSGEHGIMKVARFNGDTAQLARRAAEEFRHAGVKRVILDLRYNPGGTVAAAQALAGLWLDDQVVMTERRGDRVIKTVRSTGRPLLAEMPTVVLINNGSASASEIVAGALRDHGKARLIGEKSYGKGSVQQLINLSGGSKLKVTEARWFTAKGVSIDGQGIQPDEVVELSADDVNAGRDPQLDQARQ